MNSREHGSAVARGRGQRPEQRAQAQRAQRAKLGSGPLRVSCRFSMEIRFRGPTLPWSSEGLGQSEVPATAGCSCFRLSHPQERVRLSHLVPRNGCCAFSVPTLDSLVTEQTWALRSRSSPSRARGG